MKKLNYLLLTLGLIAGSLHGAARSDLENIAKQTQSPSKQTLESQLHECNLQILIFQEFLLEQEVAMFKSLQSPTTPPDALERIKQNIIQINTQRFTLQQAIKTYNSAPFASDIHTSTDITIRECSEDEDGETLDYETTTEAINKEIKQLKKTVENIQLSMQASKGLSRTPRQQFATNPARRRQTQKSAAGPKWRIEALKQDARED
ncbi:hypothetical protein K2X40_01685 [Candidatus Babeliales bacterium]|nr:hypothetical protein [Candidatus Babeliales bacterium]